MKKTGCIQGIAKVVTKIAEIFHWIAVALMGGATLCSVVAPAYSGSFVALDAKECCGAHLELYGFAVNAPVTEGQVDLTAFLLFGIGATLILALMATIFRSLHLVIKKSENNTPFQQENVRLFKRVGLLSVAVPAVAWLMTLLMALIPATRTVEASVSWGGLVIGLVVLCFAEFIIHGIRLEADVDGLV